MPNLPKHTAKDAPLEAEKLSLEAELALLTNQVAEQKKLAETASVTRGDVEQAQAVLQAVEGEIMARNGTLGALSSDLNALTAEKDALSHSVENKRAELSKLESEVSHKSEMAIALRDATDELENVRTLRSIVLKEKETQDAVLKDLNDRIATVRSGYDAHEASLAEILLQKLERERELRRIEKEIEDKEESLRTREGDVSLKESWLANKEEKLKRLKRELEEYYGRKFPYIHL